MNDELKTKEMSFQERENLFYNDRQLFLKWQDRQGSQDVPTTLDSTFKLIDRRNTFMQGKDYPRQSFQYLSDFGYARINIYAVNQDKKIIITSNDLYTQGHDGQVRGRGKDGLRELNKILQSIADASGYRVVEIAVPNFASNQLLTPQLDYEPFSEAVEKSLELQVTSYDSFRWKNLMFQAKGFCSKVKTFQPNTKGKVVSHGLDTVLELINLNLDRTK